MDSSIRNSSLLQYSGGCTKPQGPSGKTVRVNEQYVLRLAATVQAFHSAFNQKLDAIAFLGHGSAAYAGTPNEFSFGINFYYPSILGRILETRVAGIPGMPHLCIRSNRTT
jgi:hypothetical protein